MGKLAEDTELDEKPMDGASGPVAEQEKETKTKEDRYETRDSPAVDSGPDEDREQPLGSNLPPYLRDQLLSETASSSSMNARRTSTPPAPIPPAYFDSQPSSQPPNYLDKSNRSRPKSIPRTLTPSTPSEIASVCPPPPAHWKEEDKKKRGFRERMKSMFQSDPELDADLNGNHLGPRRDHGSQPVANVFGARVSSVKAREMRPGKKAGSWR
jgi:hypothetical protein